MVIALGAGLAGLTAAHHLQRKGRDALVFERADEPGGLCRSMRADGFTFDRTGHVLHLRDTSLRAWLDEILPADTWLEVDRSSAVWSHETLTPYPFQANTAGLPVDVRLECLLGFIDTLRDDHPALGAIPDATPLAGGPSFLNVRPPVADDEPNFHDWILSTFGEGFAKHFFRPYNEKQWQRDLREITGDWVSWSIPRPELTDVLRGAITANDKAFGYNPHFLYPREGGIDRLPNAIAATLADDTIRTGCEVVALEAATRRVTVRDASGVENVHDAPAILSSLPLARLAAMTTDLPAPLREAATSLSAVSVRCIDLGVRGEAPFGDTQWVYVPERDAPFHRVGFPKALCPAMAPDGCYSVAAEIAFRADDDPGVDRHLAVTREHLAKMGAVPTDADVVTSHVDTIADAYVVFDKARRAALAPLLSFYVKHGVIPMGRYGTWDYLSMQDSLAHGRDAAEWSAAR